MNLNFDTKQLQLSAIVRCGMDHNNNQKIHNRNIIFIKCNTPYHSHLHPIEKKNHQIIIISINRTECLNFFCVYLIVSIYYYMRQITNLIQDAQMQTKEEEVQRPLNFANR